MKFPFKFIVIGKLNIWQLVQLIGLSKSFTGLLHFWHWYFSSRNINVTAWCCLYYSEFPTKVLPIWNEISLKDECLTLPWSLGFFSSFQRITPHPVPFLIEKKCSFLSLVTYIYENIYVVYMCIHICILFQIS
jgi:hypothetical protein